MAMVKDIKPNKKDESKPDFHNFFDDFWPINFRRNYYSFFDELGTYGNVTSSGSYSDDITQTYRDTVSEIENLKIQEERLREILKNLS